MSNKIQDVPATSALRHTHCHLVCVFVDAHEWGDNARKEGNLYDRLLLLMLHERLLNGSHVVELLLSGLQQASNLAIGRGSSVLGILFVSPQLEHGFLELFYRTTALLRAITPSPTYTITHFHYHTPALT